MGKDIQNENQEKIKANFYENDEREKLFKKHLRKLRKIIKNLPIEKKSVCENIIKNIAMCSVQLDELNEMINRDGFFQQYKNGENQWGLKRSITFDAMLQVGKLYASYLQRLESYMPEGDAPGDALTKFKKNQEEKLAAHKNKNG
jgi:hypothetical protein